MIFYADMLRLLAFFAKALVLFEICAAKKEAAGKC